MALATNNDSFATSALEAWEQLLENGLETAGRDQDLVDLLRKVLVGEKLAQNREDLKIILRTVSLEEFVRAFFQVAAPYIDMLKDILKWFERAEATHGPHGWKMAWDGAEMEELRSFRKWIATLEQGGELISYPALSNDECWRLLLILDNVAPVHNTLCLVRKQDYQGLPSCINNFAFSYGIDCYDDIDTLPAPPESSGPVWMIWNVIRRVLSQLIASGMDREKIRAAVRSGNYPVVAEDGFATSSIYARETDLWLLKLVSAYGTLCTLTAEQRDDALSYLDDWLKTLPTASYLIANSADALSAFLDLPLWRRRHEFYAAWIASKLVDACDGHEMILRSESGVIALPFRKTIVAELLTPSRHILMSEVRTQLEDPADKTKRKGNVQPDFTFWRADDGTDVCDLVVEVKHYLRPAKKSWVDVFTDYARAHPQAKVVLVNYGEAGSALESISDSALKERCLLIGDMRPGQLGSLQVLEKAVQDVIGIPPAKDGPVAVIVDKSQSNAMPYYRLNDLLRELVEQHAATSTGVATSSGDQIWPVGLNGVVQVLNADHNSEVEFTPILEKVLETHAAVIFVTDADGESYLDPSIFSIEKIHEPYSGRAIVCRVELKRAGAGGIRSSR